MKNTFIYGIVLFYCALTYPTYLEIKADDHLKGVIVNGVPINLSYNQSKTVSWGVIQASYFEADVNDLIVVICKNNGGDMGIKGYINFNGFNYLTDLTSWKWNDTDPMIYVSGFIGKKTVRNNEIVEYYFRIPQKATAHNFNIRTKTLIETDPSVIVVVDIKGNITLSAGIALNSLYVVFLSIPLMMKGKILLYDGTYYTGIIENTNYSPDSEFRFKYTFADIHALNSNVFKITYVLKDRVDNRKRSFCVFFR